MEKQTSLQGRLIIQRTACGKKWRQFLKCLPTASGKKGVIYQSSECLEWGTRKKKKKNVQDCYRITHTNTNKHYTMLTDQQLILLDAQFEIREVSHFITKEFVSTLFLVLSTPHSVYLCLCCTDEHADQCGPKVRTIASILGRKIK